jgi:hypothetical protein
MRQAATGREGDRLGPSAVHIGGTVWRHFRPSTARKPLALPATEPTFVIGSLATLHFDCLGGCSGRRHLISSKVAEHLNLPLRLGHRPGSRRSMRNDDRACRVPPAALTTCRVLGQRLQRRATSLALPKARKMIFERIYAPPLQTTQARAAGPADAKPRARRPAWRPGRRPGHRGPAGGPSRHQAERSRARPCGGPREPASLP